MPYVPVGGPAIPRERAHAEKLEQGGASIDAEMFGRSDPARGAEQDHGEPISRGRREEVLLAHSAAAAVAIQTYWAATGRAFRLQTLAARTTHPAERQALLELEEAEELRREVARRALNEIWGIDLASRSTSAPNNVVPWPVADHLH